MEIRPVIGDSFKAQPALEQVTSSCSKNEKGSLSHTRPPQEENVHSLTVCVDRESEIGEAIDRLNKLVLIFGRRFHFELHEGTKRYFVQVIDQETGEVISEVPPEKILDLVAEIWRLVGLLVDEKV